MSGSYRVEISVTGRAGCSATHCKKEAVKIQKGELRQGVLVTIQEHQSWKFRHWGCVTPTVIHNWYESADGDMEMIDGYEDLPADAQARVKRAFEQGHVDDEDWNGDIECNRYDPANEKQGMFVKTPKKKAGDDNEVGESSPTKKKPSKKRGRKDAEEAAEHEDKPAPKKGRAKKAVKNEELEEEVEEAPPAKKTKRTKKVKDEEVEAPAVAAPAAKKSKAKKPNSSAAAVDNEDVADPLPPAKKSKSKKAATKPVKDEEEAEPEPEPEPKSTKLKPSKKSRARRAADE